MWSDYFEPDFCDPDSPSYAGDEYLPLFGEKYRGQPGFVGDMWEECTKNPVWDFRDSIRVVRELNNPLNRYEKLRQRATEIDEDEKYDSYFEVTSQNTLPISQPEKIPYSKPIDQEYRFTFGKYKGKRLADVLTFDRQYVKWCRENVSFFNH